jgi:predicted outer membrane protein
MKCVSLCVLAAASALLWGGAWGAETASAKPVLFAPSSVATLKRLSPEQREEWRFLKDAAANSRFESDAARLALSRSNNARVRDLAATLINHHTSAAAVLNHMLYVRSMAPPMLGNDQRKLLNRMAKLHGTKFDRMFMEEVGLKSQQLDVEAFERISAAVADPVLRAWIDGTMPTVRYHLQTAEQIMASDTRLAKVTPPPAPPRYVTKASLATRSMGAAPAHHPMRNAHLGPQPIAARATESSSR